MKRLVALVLTFTVAIFPSFSYAQQSAPTLTKEEVRDAAQSMLNSRVTRGDLSIEDVKSLSGASEIPTTAGSGRGNPGGSQQLVSGCAMVAGPVGCFVQCGENLYWCLGGCGFTAFWCGYDSRSSSEFEACIALWCNTVVRQEQIDSASVDESSSALISK